MDFGERILMDLKQLEKGYMIVVIDHWSNYCWLSYLPDKKASGVEDFLTNTVFPDIDAIRASWKDTHEESKRIAKGGVSYPVNRGEVKVEADNDDIQVSVMFDDDAYLQV